MDGALVEIDGYQRGSRIEHRRDGGHERRTHACEQQPFESSRDQLLHEHQISLVGLGQVGKHFERDDSRHDEKEWHNDVQEPGANHTYTRVPFIFGAEHALHHVLAGTAIPKAD